MAEDTATPQPRDHKRLIEDAFQQIRDLTVLDQGDATRVVGAAPADLPFPATPDAIPGYHIVREIARGGQGVVYMAHQQTTHRRVAIKLLLSGPFASRDERARFEREVRTLGRLRHPGIVAIHHSGTFGGGFYYVMDYIDGEPLDQYVRARRLDYQRILGLFATICDAISAAHQRGIIHRDLKPGNVRVDEHGAPHVLDFGLSKLADDPEAPSATRTGQFVGSAPWASPEQAAGEPEAIDVRTDVYSLGVLLFQMLTDRFPYPVTGRPSEILEAIQHAPPQRPRSIRRDIPEDVETIVLMCLQKEPARRYQSASELAADVQRCLRGEPIAARRDSGWYVLRKQLWRHRLPLSVGAAFIGLLLLSSVVAWSLFVRANRARADAEDRTREATARLWDSYLAQARAARSSNRIGRRFDALQAVRHAAEIRASVELRNEALAALTLHDLRIDRDYAVPYRATSAGLRRLDRFAHADDQGRVEVLAVDDGRLLADLQGPPKPAWFSVFSPDGEYLAVKYHTAGSVQDAEFWLWDVGRAAPVLKRGPDTANVTFAFHPDGGRMALAQRDRTLTILEIPSGRPVRSFTIGAEPYRLAYDPSGRWLAVSSLSAPFLEVWDTESGTLACTPDAPSAIRGPNWNRDGTRLIGPCDDRHAYIWEFPGGRRTMDLAGHQGEVVEAYFDPSDRFVVSWGWDNVARFWDAGSGELLLRPVEGWMVREVRDRLAIERRPFSFSVAQFESPVGLEQYALRGENGWNTAALSADGAFLVAAGETGVWLWERRTGRVPRQLLAGRASHAHVFDDGVILAGEERGVRRWRTERNGAELIVRDDGLLWPQESIISMSASPDGRWLVARAAQSLILFDTKEKSVAARFAAHRGLHGHPSVSRDGRWVFGGTWRGAPARVIDVASGEAVLELPGYQVHGRFSPDGRLVVSERDEYRVYSVPDGALLRRIPRRAHAAIAGDSAFWRDGSVAALTRAGYDIFLVDLRSGEVLVELDNPDLALYGSMHVSGDGRALAATSAQAIRVWDIDRLRTELRGLGLDWRAP